MQIYSTVPRNFFLCPSADVYKYSNSHQKLFTCLCARSTPSFFFILSWLLWQRVVTTKREKIKPEKMLSFRILLAFCIVSVVSAQQVAERDERPFLRIVAPKFICNKGKGSQMAQTNNVTVGLQTREGQSLRYKITVDFEMLGGEFKSQQHTLSIWKNIRLLQKRFNNLSEEISLKNQIEINAKEVWV